MSTEDEAAHLARQADRAKTSPEALIADAEEDAVKIGHGQAAGVPAKAQHEGHRYNPTGGPAVRHWQKAQVSDTNLDERGNVFFAAVAMTRMPMTVVDARQEDMPLVFANGAFFDLTGYTPDEVYGRNCRFLQGAATDLETVRQLGEAVRDHRPIAVEVLNYRKDGTTFWNALFIGPIYDGEGELAYFFASQLDVTGRRNSEDSFRQAQRMEAIGQLTAGLAHDFNNALQVILGNLKRAEGKLDNEAELRKAIDRATRAGESAAKLTKQLLGFARKTRLAPKALVLNDIVVEFGEMLSRTLGDTIEIDYQLEEHLPPCIVDPIHAEMALLNVLTNARDAMGAGGKAIVKTETTSLDEFAVLLGGDGIRAGRYVVLSVEDDGEGMTSDVLARSAEPFFTTKKGKGTGLGLAMVHGFVRQSGGRVEIDSAPGKGTTVRMLFPVATDKVPSPAKAEPVLNSHGGAEIILAVDDNEDVLDLAVHHLTVLGYTVLAARSGEEALTVLERTEGKIDLLFSDIVMPGGMNGIVLAERARALYPWLRVLLATGYNEDVVSRTPLLAGALVLGKPYRQTDLAGQVRVALRQPMPKQGIGPAHSG
jgi:PAS domain S-box-containing protein